ncbi:hypothetical protein K491DRAFT_684241 [Lophiostoma macrostomum CBS 122681]|uniref:Uncharacterized protein n=1 Tax=Lophiostoma macrostomum CBS 122681 TaxID=1314788 RepID=A0A6A6SRK1_9PLEO|nr:hypothetical protein K491DRAFT_684241 [Lophiostoma macrostomum CBS 122681]
MPNDSITLRIIVHAIDVAYTFFEPEDSGPMPRSSALSARPSQRVPPPNAGPNWLKHRKEKERVHRKKARTRLAAQREADRVWQEAQVQQTSVAFQYERFDIVKEEAKRTQPLEITVAGPKEVILADDVEVRPPPMAISAWAQAPVIVEDEVRLSDEQFTRLALSLRPLLQQLVEQEPVLDFLAEHNDILTWLLDPKRQSERPSHVPLRIPSDLFARAISTGQPEVEAEHGLVSERQDIAAQGHSLCDLHSGALEFDRQRMKEYEVKYRQVWPRGIEVPVNLSEFHRYSDMRDKPVEWQTHHKGIRTGRITEDIARFTPGAHIQPRLEHLRRIHTVREQTQHTHENADASVDSQLDCSPLSNHVY